MIAVWASERHRRHDPHAEIESSGVQPPFEHPGRAEVIRAALAGAGGFSVAEPPVAGTAPVEAVHDPGLVRFLATAWADYQRDVRGVHDVVPDVFGLAALREGMEARGEPTATAARLGWWCYETTTPLTEGAFDAACSAVDSALAAAGSVLAGAPLAYALCRPPGHHAARSLYGGYCFFNNAAIAAHHLATATGSRVAVLDVDYHHGNGTQQLFYGRDDVGFASLHGDPRRAYPYHTGFADEVGTGRGRGFTHNVPLPADVDDDAFVAALERVLAVVDTWRPAIVVVSLGLDPYVDDPMCDLAVTTEGFRRCGTAVARLGLPLVVVQEGGYADDALGVNVVTWLRGADAGR